MEEIQIEKHIYLYKNVLTKEQCEDLINRYEITNATRKGSALFRDKVEEIEVPTFDPTDPDYNADASELWKGIDDSIMSFSDKVLHTYMKHYMLQPYEYAYSGCKMLFYPPQSHSPTHYDDELVAKDGGDIGVARPITLVVYLNDDFDGGELLFPDQGVALKPVQGSIAVFPASYMYPHTTVPTCGKHRYILLPFYRKAGLNAKIKEYNEKLIKNKKGYNEFRSLYLPEDSSVVEGVVPLLTKEL